MFSIAKHKDKSCCPAYACGKKKSKKDRFCPRHSRMYQKYNNPVNYTYNVLRNNALRRSKVFTLTLEEFKEFCDSTGYMDKKGRRAFDSSIDRIDSSRGYEKGNLQILTISQNSSKGARSYNDCPF